ncbi:MAG: hypothetical protein LBK59_02275 [Bifidobacteriaceae bacterium]|jgi:hypothetical protein|nr:hypothetical protein [Bifidobacteriaceae bacterium]
MSVTWIDLVLPYSVLVPHHASAARDGTWPWASHLSRRARRDTCIALVIAAVGAVVAFARLPGLARGTVWAEDGSVFLAEFAADGWTTMFRSYSGYLHLGPRVITGVAASVAPLDLFAVTMTVLTSVIAGLCGAITFLATRGVVMHMVPRIVVATVPIAAPLLPIEVLGNATNLHWLGLWVTPWIIIYRPRRWPVSVVMALVVLVAALSEVQVLIFLPLIVLTWRRGKSAPVNAALAVGVVAQVMTTLAYPRVNQPSDVHLTVMDLVDSTLAQTVLGAYTGDNQAVAEALAGHGLVLGWLGLVPFVSAGAVAAWVAARRLPPGASRRRWLAALAVCVIAAGSLLAVAAVMNPGPRYAMSTMDSPELRDFLFSRYAVVPSMFLLAIPALAADALLTRRKGRHSNSPGRSGASAARVVAAVLVALVILVEAAALRPPWTRRSDGPGWSSAVTAARQSCTTGGQDEASIPLAPKGWAVTIPCPDLR